MAVSASANGSAIASWSAADAAQGLAADPSRTSRRPQQGRGPPEPKESERSGCARSAKRGPGSTPNPAAQPRPGRGARPVAAAETRLPLSRPGPWLTAAEPEIHQPRSASSGASPPPHAPCCLRDGNVALGKLMKKRAIWPAARRTHGHRPPGHPTEKPPRAVASFPLSYSSDRPFALDGNACRAPPDRLCLMAPAWSAAVGMQPQERQPPHGGLTNIRWSRRMSLPRF
jgi:hypothetical protein